jgi:acetolactate synthase I/II/III large subunit
LRRDDLRRRALRRPHHRAARRLLAGSKKIHIDIDPSSINKNVHVDIGRSSATAPCARRHGAAVARGRGHAGQEGACRLVETDRRMAREKVARLQEHERHHQAAIRGQRLYELTKDMDTYITTEVGQHQMWAAQFYPFRGAAAG